MTPEEAAAATTPAVSGIASHFMLDPGTYAKGAELGFAGLDFYAGGRGGVLGEVDADVVAAAFAFFEPGYVRTNWEQAAAAASRADASAAFMACGHDWADAHLGDDVDWARLADLLGRIAEGANPAVAPLFAAWRAAPAPADGASDKAVALHRFNLLRELRNGLHAAAVVANGLTPAEALMVKTPYMAPIFGYAEPPEVGDDEKARHDAAEAATNAALAQAYAVLSTEELDELVSLCEAAVGAVA